MTLQNRVHPTGEIVAEDWRGGMTGNRGILHDDRRSLGVRRWQHKAWIVCRLKWKGVRRVPMTPGRWTELFFTDEACAMAAGHRPCAYCRRSDYNAFKAAWGMAHGAASAPGMDAVLHRARVRRDRNQVRHEARFHTLPDGAFVLHEGAPALVLDDRLHAWAYGAYGRSVPRPDGIAAVLTPAPLVDVLTRGFRPKLHPDLTAPPR